MAVVRRGKKYGVVVYRRGARVWVGTYAKEKDAKNAEARAMLDGLDPSSSVTVQGFADEWLRVYPRPKVSTQIHYEQQIKGFVSVFGKSRLADLTRSRMRAWAVDHPGQAAVARAMLGDAQRDRLIPENPLAALRLPQSRGRRDLVALTENEVDELALVAEAVHGVYGERMYGPMIRFAAATGLRPGELHALRWQDVDLEERLVVVARQWNHRARAFTSPKNGRPRNVELIPAAVHALRVRAAHSDETGIVFRTAKDRMFDGATHYYWNPVRAAFGRPDMDWYELRHAFGTLLARHGVSAPAIARQMGHTDGGKLALERYIHMAAQDARDEVRRAFDRPQLSVVRSEEAQSA